jgi:hypothetical protein
MNIASARFIVDSAGQRQGVILSLGDYERMLAVIEEYDDIRAYDSAKAAGDEAVPFEEAVREIESVRHDL